jgi:iron complex outermembrane recepter protein
MLDWSNIYIMFVEQYCMKCRFYIWLVLVFLLSQAIPTYAQHTNQFLDTSIRKPIPINIEKLLEGESEEVVVTGLSRAGFQKENPITIQAISSKTIDRTIASNIMDQLSLHSPGVSVLKTGPNISKPFIRGLGYHRVLTLYDGIRQEGQQWGDEHGLEVDGFQIHRAEIIKGPASLLFGSDAIAGVVSLIPYLPKLDQGQIEGRVLTEYQSNNGLWASGVRLGQRSKHWLWQASASKRIAGNYSNAIDGKVYLTGFQETNLGFQTGYYSKKGSSLLSATYYDNLQAIPDGSRDSASRQFTKQVLDGQMDDVKNRPLVSENELNGYALSGLVQSIKHYRVYSKHQYQFGKIDLDALVGFQQNNRKEFTHPAWPDQAGLSLQLNTLNYGINLNMPLSTAAEMSIGANGMYQQNKHLNATDFPIPNFQLWDLGAYVHGKWNWQNWHVAGGLRWDQRQLTSADFYTGPNLQNGFEQQYHFPDTAGSVLQFPAFEKRFNGYSFALGVAYNINTTWSLKANLSRGYRAPSITELASNGLDPGAHILYLGNRAFVPETSWQQDLGISLTTAQLQWSLSLFHNRLNHFIYLTQLLDASGLPQTDAQGNKTFQYQQAAARLLGFESEIKWHPSFLPQWNMTSSIAYVQGENLQERFNGKGNQGEWLPLIPPTTWQGSIEKNWVTNISWMPNLHITASWEAAAAQNRYLALYGTETRTAAYTLFHLGCGTSLTLGGKRQLTIQCQINNLFDLAYQNHLSRLKYLEYYQSAPNGNSGIYNMGRNASIKCIFSF